MESQFTGMAEQMSRIQNGEDIERFLRSSAEAGYRPRDCHNCGRRRMSVCEDGMLRCEKCSLEEPATAEDLGSVFGTLEDFKRRFAK